MSDFPVRFRPKGVKTSAVDPEVMILFNMYVGKGVLEVYHRVDGKCVVSYGYLTDFTSEYLRLGKSPTLSDKDFKIPFHQPESYITSVCAVDPSGEKTAIYKNPSAFFSISTIQLPVRK